MNTVTFPYNLKVILSYIFGGALIAIISPLVAYYQGALNEAAIPITIFSVTIMGVVCFLAFKYLIPALKNNPALMLTEKELNFCVNNIRITWDDIQDIELRELKGKGGSEWILYISLKGTTSYNDDIKAGLRWINGDPEFVFEKVYNYFHQTQQFK